MCLFLTQNHFQQVCQAAQRILTSHSSGEPPSIPSLNYSHFALGRTQEDNHYWCPTPAIMQHPITLSHWNKKRENGASEWFLCGKCVLKIIKHSIPNSYCWWKETCTKSVFLTLRGALKWAVSAPSRGLATHINPQPRASRDVRTLVILQGM